MQVRLNSSILENALLSVVHVTIRNTGEIIKSIPVDVTQSSSVLQLQLSKSVVVVVCTKAVHCRFERTDSNFSQNTVHLSQNTVQFRLYEQ
jgi:hypothetical protein